MRRLFCLFCLACIVCTVSLPAQGAPQGPTRVNIVEKIEARLGKPLSEEQRTKVRDAITTLTAALTQQQTLFIERVADITGLPAIRLRAIMPRIGQESRPFAACLGDIERELNRKLNKVELEKISAADQEKVQTMSGPRQAFVKQVAAICGLAVNDIYEIMPRLAGKKEDK